MQYELFYLVGERQEATLDAIREGVKNILVAGKASLLEPELTEKRKLAYEIKHQSKGTYITRRFEMPDADQMDELNASAEKSNDEKEFGIEAITKKLNLNNNVLRFLIVKTEDLPDLGAKDRRKAQEMSAPKAAPQRPQQRPGDRQRPAYQPRRQEQPKPVPAEKKAEEAKEIDKQLDKLLDI
jgi:ribosomal protein S6